MEFCELEIYDILLCNECYERKCAHIQDVVTGVCEIPHLVLWAKCQRWPHWPAKAISILDGGQIEVLFFNQHETAKVPYTRCMLFSEEHPDETIDFAAYNGLLESQQVSQ